MPASWPERPWLALLRWPALVERSPCLTRCQEASLARMRCGRHQQEPADLTMSAAQRLLSVCRHLTGCTNSEQTCVRSVGASLHAQNTCWDNLGILMASTQGASDWTVLMIGRTLRSQPQHTRRTHCRLGASSSQAGVQWSVQVVQDAVHHLLRQLAPVLQPASPSAWGSWHTARHAGKQQQGRCIPAAAGSCCAPTDARRFICTRGCH